MATTILLTKATTQLDHMNKNDDDEQLDGFRVLQFRVHIGFRI